MEKQPEETNYWLELLSSEVFVGVYNVHVQLTESLMPYTPTISARGTNSAHQPLPQFSARHKCVMED